MADKKKYPSEMGRTTIYLPEHLRKAYFEMSLKESSEAGKRIGMAEIIRRALEEYARKHYKP